VVNNFLFAANGCCMHKGGGNRGRVKNNHAIGFDSFIEILK
jgi:hypothetical protein